MDEFQFFAGDLPLVTHHIRKNKPERHHAHREFQYPTKLCRRIHNAKKSVPSVFGMSGTAALMLFRHDRAPDGARRRIFTSLTTDHVMPNGGAAAKTLPERRTAVHDP